MACGARPDREIFAAPNLTRDTPSHTIAFFSDLVRKTLARTAGSQRPRPVAEAFFGSGPARQDDVRVGGAGSPNDRLWERRLRRAARTLGRRRPRGVVFPKLAGCAEVSGMAKHPLSDWLTD